MWLYYEVIYGNYFVLCIMRYFMSVYMSNGNLKLIIIFVEMACSVTYHCRGYNKHDPPLFLKLP